MSWNWSLVIGLVVIVLMIIARFWPLMRAAQAKRQAAKAELIARLTSVEQKTTAPASPTTPTANAPKKRATDAFGWGLRMAATIIILFITGWVINALIPNRITEPIFGDGKPAKQKWDPYDEIRTCSVRWNAEEAGPWCEAMVLPPGTYRIIPVFEKMWLHANVSRNGVLQYHNIPAQGIMLRSIWDPTDRFYREFLRQAPLGGNMWFGRLVVRVGDKFMHDPFEHDGFTITKPTKVLVGINIPPFEQYVAMDQGSLPFDIERLRQ